MCLPVRYCSEKEESSITSKTSSSKAINTARAVPQEAAYLRRFSRQFQRQSLGLTCFPRINGDAKFLLHNTRRPYLDKELGQQCWRASEKKRGGWWSLEVEDGSIIVVSG
ncbi:hypothetical protein PoB_007078300 [Plakobranchus ocellatus]|uniref:Uncharacterized protein n=1 Tax=Plakobranchus ocellatus TaxID=259542 RepID=A0AAV4DJ67_9GAST|nr:hypothetical protein PoB_007078300 [Plakobranchus ocellatus]